MERRGWVTAAVASAAIAIAVVVAYVVVAWNRSTPVEGARDAVVIAAGDIALCSRDDDERTAAIVADIAGTVLVAGDGAYHDGTIEDYRECYEPSWGQFLNRTRPAPGNHDHRTRGAAGYFEYFGDRAGPPGRGYYSFDLGAWHIISLDSNCDEAGVDCTGEQLSWLRQDLSATSTSCVLAFWHHPLFSSARGGDEAVRPFWEALYEARADVIITGHDHVYERFGPQDPTGELDTDRGIRQFVVGSGGGQLYPITSPAPNSEERIDDRHGVLKLTLRSDGYDWQFVTVDGGTVADQGSDTCR